MINRYKGRIVRYDFDWILDKYGEKGIDTVITKKSSWKKPITIEECYEYLNFQKSIRCLDVCKVGYPYECIAVNGNRYARDIDHNSYICYPDLCHAIPSDIKLEDYGEDILRRALKDTCIDRTDGTISIALYCPVSFLAKHFILSGCREKYQKTFLDLVNTLERIPSAVRIDQDMYEEEYMYIYPQSPYDYYLHASKQK